MAEKAILWHGPTMDGLAKRICTVNPNIELGEIDWREFGDGMPRISVAKHKGVRKKTGVFLMDLSDKRMLLDYLSVLQELPRMGPKEIKALLPYYPTGTMERGDTEDEVVTAKTLARLISATPLCRSGPIELVLYDAHSLVLRSFFGDNVLTRYKTGTKWLCLLLEETKCFDLDNVVIVFPDLGAWKRFHTHFDGSKPGSRKYQMAICDKIRVEGGEHIITLREGKVAGRDCIIFDDKGDTGGTLLKSGELLMTLGAKSVSASVTHPVFPNEAWKKFIGSVFTYVWVSDSVPAMAEKLDGVGPFRMFSLDRSLARVILDEDDEGDENHVGIHPGSTSSSVSHHGMLLTPNLP